MSLILRCQTKVRYQTYSSLPIEAGIRSLIQLDRNNKITEIQDMKALFLGFIPAGPNAGVLVEVWDGTGTLVGDFGLPCPLSYTDTLASDYWNEISSNIISGLAGNGVTISSSDISYLPPLLSSLSRIYNYPSLAVNTSRQASTTQDALIVASVEIDATLSLTTGAKGTVTLKYADDSAFTTNVVIASVSPNGNTGTLSVGVNTVGSGGGPVVGIIPANKYYRLVTTNVTGTPTYGTPVIQEVLL